jgi:hypothetical protein
VTSSRKRAWQDIQFVSHVLPEKKKDPTNEEMGKILCQLNLETYTG